MQVSGVRVVAPGPEGRSDLRAFSWSQGVTVALLVTAPQKNIIGVLKDSSKISSFTDDKGTDLIGSETEKAEFSTWFSSDKTAEKSVLVEANAPGLPAKSATSLNLSGMIAVQTASQTTNIAAENVELKVGSEFSLGLIKFSISGVRLQGTDLVVTLQAKQDLAAISRVEFYDTDGTKIDSHRYSSSSFGFMGSTTYTWDYSLKKHLDKAKISAVVWTDLKTIEVPVSVKTGVGL